MIARLACGSLYGVDAYRVDIEVDFSRRGIPAFVMVGLAEGAVREARERVSSALRASGFRIPPARITVNLAPADRRKAGSAYDLPLAIGLLAACGIVAPEKIQGWMPVGELSLNGEIRPVPGVLPLALLARAEGARGMLVAPEAGDEAAVVKGLAVYTPRTLGEAAAFLAGESELAPRVCTPPRPETAAYARDFSEVKGQEHAKRAIEIAAAGAHNLLFIGPPGSGKTMLAQRIPTVLPPLSFDEALEVTKIYSVAGLLGSRGLMTGRPFRSPHHTVSDIALIGGGALPRPGEVCLAHRGVLFLDELPEFRRSALEVLRQPLEDGMVTISRVARALSYPADCMLVAAMNPCPCGYRGDSRHACTCSPTALDRYRAKLSGPLLDRIDLHVEVPAVPREDLQAPVSGRTGTDSASMRERVARARAIQTRRYAGTSCRANSALSGAMLDQYCALDAESREFIGLASDRLGLSARAYTRILRIARTIADMEESPSIRLPHLAEAVNCRVLDRENQT